MTPFSSSALRQSATRQPELGRSRLPPCASPHAVFTATGDVFVPCIFCKILYATAQYGRARAPPRSSRASSHPPGRAPRRGARKELAPRLSPPGQRRQACTDLAAQPLCAARPLQVLQACADQLARSSPRAWRQAFVLQLVCRCAPPLTCRRSRRQELRLRPDARGRRFKEALEQPFWSTLDRTFGGVLCRALGRPGAPLPRPSVTTSKISGMQRCPRVHESAAGGCPPPALLLRLNRVRPALNLARAARAPSSPWPPQGRPRKRAPGGGSGCRALLSSA